MKGLNGNRGTHSLFFFIMHPLASKEDLPLKLSLNLHIHSTDIQILLKRYLCSGAFVNVAAELARYLRCLASDRPSLLNIDKMIINIKAWMTQEVEWIAMMNEEALRRVFSRMWKFSNKWSEFLHPDTLPFELQKLQVHTYSTSSVTFAVVQMFK